MPAETRELLAKLTERYGIVGCVTGRHARDAVHIRAGPHAARLCGPR